MLIFLMHEKKEQLPLDAKLLSLAIIELNISRRNVAIYPENHPSIKTAIHKAFNHLQELFELRNQITLAIAKNELIIDEYILEKKNPVYHEFATSLYTMGVASLTFVSGITEEEITSFHQIIVANLDDINRRGGLEKIMQELGINHIKVGLIDYEAFHFVQGQKEVTQEKKDIWEDYIYGLMEGKLLTEADSDEIRGIPPHILAEMVNRTMPEAEGGESYERVIATYLHKRSDEKRLKKGALGNIMNFIEGLKPGLKKQFLSGTFKHLSADPAETAKLSEGLSSEQLMLVLKEINEKDEIIPETLKNLLKKFSKVQMKAVTIDTKHLMDGESVIDDIQLSPEAVKLFEQESSFQDYVTASYRAELEKIIDAEFKEVDKALIAMIQSELNEESLDRFIANLFIELLETNMLSVEELSNVREQLLEYITAFLQTGQFGELTTIYEKMSVYIDQNKHREISIPILKHMKSTDFVTDLITSYKYWGRKNREEVIEFSKRLKEELVTPLLSELMGEENAFLRSFYLSILSDFGDFIIPYAKERLTDERWFVKRNMINLLRESGSQSVLKIIKPYCEHRDIRLSIEAIKAFLQFDSPDGFRFIKEHLQSNKLEVRDQVIKLIGTFRVKRLVPDLIRLLVKKDALGGDFHLKIPIVRALGDVGDKRALPYLLEIVRSKSLLYKNSLDQLKMAIFESLDNYPVSEIEPLVKEGLNSKNEKIFELSSLLLDRIGANG